MIPTRQFLVHLMFFRVNWEYFGKFFELLAGEKITNMNIIDTKSQMFTFDKLLCLNRGHYQEQMCPFPQRTILIWLDRKGYPLLHSVSFENGNFTFSCMLSCAMELLWILYLIVIFPALKYLNVSYPGHDIKWFAWLGWSVSKSGKVL